MAQKKSNEIDGGYAYAILFGSAMVYSLVIGGFKAYGPLYTAMLKYFGTSASDTGWMTSINCFLFDGLAPVSNALSKRYSFRRVTFIGGLLSGTGFVLSSLVPAMEYNNLTFGVITGLGMGLALTPCITLISYFFVKRRFFANGFSFALSGIWGAGQSFLYDYFITTYGLRGTLLITGGITFHICVAACLFIQPHELRTDSEDSDKTDVNDKSSQGFRSKVAHTVRCISSECKLYTDLLKIPSIVCFEISLMLLMYSYTGGLILLAAEVNHRGLTKTDEAINVSVFGGFDVVGKLFFGWFSDLNILKPRNLYIINMTAAAGFTLMVPYIKSLTYLRVYAGALGFFLGSFTSLLPPFLIETLGMERYPQGIGLSFISMSIMMLIGIPTLGVTADGTGNWDSAFVLCSVLLLIGALILVGEQFVTKICSRKHKHVIEEPAVWITRL